MEVEWACAACTFLNPTGFPNHNPDPDPSADPSPKATRNLRATPGPYLQPHSPKLNNNPERSPSSNYNTDPSPKGHMSINTVTVTKPVSVSESLIVTVSLIN